MDCIMFCRRECSGLYYVLQERVLWIVLCSAGESVVDCTMLCRR